MAVLHSRLARTDRRTWRKFYPTSVLVTGYDILFFWVARMMMFGLYAMDGEAPFRDDRLHGMVRDEHGKKMSKSFGNVVDPLDWIDEYGADAPRFTLARGANPGTDVPIGEDWVQGSRNFANKIWNATRFALMNGATAGAGCPPPSSFQPGPLDPVAAARAVAEADASTRTTSSPSSPTRPGFAWDEFCDWYVELAKTSFFAGGERRRRPARARARPRPPAAAAAPGVPFVTEELWLALTQGGVEGEAGATGEAERSLVVATWPAPEQAYADPAAEAEIKP